MTSSVAKASGPANCMHSRLRQLLHSKIIPLLRPVKQRLGGSTCSTWCVSSYGIDLRIPVRQFGLPSQAQ